MAARTQNRLTDLVIRQAKAAGWYADGGGLYLRIDGAARKWVYVFQWQKKRAEMGLGALGDVSLAAARVLRDDARKLVVAGKNPIDERRREREAEAAAAAQPGPMTFGEWAEEIAPAVGPRAVKARKAWVAMLQVKVGALAAMAPAEIQTEHVLAALKPYWLSRPESGRRMRQRIERVLDAAKSKGLIPDPWANPARLRGHLENLLVKPSRKVKHLAALPYVDAPDFMADLRQRETVSACALQWTVMTLARTTETLGARWPEIDRAQKLWVVPAERMKGDPDKRREHRVPLTEDMLALLDKMEPLKSETKEQLIFPSLRTNGKRSKDGRLSDAAMQRVLDDMGLKKRATVHGLRSTFKDWASDCTNFANEVSEAALAHLVGDETERSYRRSDALLKRRKLMEAWCGYLARPRSADNVRPMSRPA